MSGKKRTTISIEQGILEKARAMMRAEDFGDFSGFIEQVIRDRWAMRNAPDAMNDATLPSASEAAPSIQGAAVSYRKNRK